MVASTPTLLGQGQRTACDRLNDAALRKSNCRHGYLGYTRDVSVTVGNSAGVIGYRPTAVLFKDSFLCMVMMADGSTKAPLAPGPARDQYGIRSNKKL